MNKATLLVDKIFDFYESSTSPEPIEVKQDMLGQILQMLPTLEAGMYKEVHDFIQFLGIQRLGITGSVEEMLPKFHPWMLQQVYQKFKIPSASPSGTPPVGMNRT